MMDLPSVAELKRKMRRIKLEEAKMGEQVPRGNVNLRPRGSYLTISLLTAEPRLVPRARGALARGNSNRVSIHTTQFTTKERQAIESKVYLELPTATPLEPCLVTEVPHNFIGYLPPTGASSSSASSPC